MAPGRGGALILAGGLALCLAAGAHAAPPRPASPPPSPSPAASPEPAARAFPALAPGEAEAVEQVLRTAMERHRIPGLSAAVLHRGALWTGALGTADVENDVPARPGTVYRLASLSKPITAVAVLQLVEAGRLGLDEPIQRSCPAFPVKRFAVTVRQLLSHQGGIRSYARGEFGSTRHFAGVADSLSLFRDDPLAFRPGTRFLYSTFGYSLLGCAVEGASGQTYLEYLKERVFAPAGMTETRQDDVYAIIPWRAGGYTRNPAGELANSAPADTSCKIPGGGLAGTAPDVARFAAALLEGTVLPRARFEAMAVAQRTQDGKPTSAGLGLYVGQRDGERELWHIGGQQQVSNVLYLRPDSHRVVVILTNLEGISSPLVDVARAVSDALGPAAR